MKVRIIVSTVVAGAILLSGAMGCKKKPERVTPIPGLGPGQIKETTTRPITPGVTPPIEIAPPVRTDVFNPDGTVPGSDLPLNTWVPAAEQPFRTETVYFDFDQSNIKPSEVPKIERVATGMKNYPGKGLRIEGHCDERGTEEYNRALGERRAQAVREYLVRLGVEARFIDTISYGEDQPVDTGHTEAAWGKNRRGEFILLEPPSGGAGAMP